jgi:prophage antirepressor-like protein
MNKIQEFFSEQFGTVRTVNLDGMIYFYGIDIAKALGYSNASKAVTTHCKRIVTKVLETSNSQNGKTVKGKVSLISKSDIYRLIVKSKLESSDQFESWIFDEILPRIESTGAYIEEGREEEMVQKYFPSFSKEVQTEMVNDLIKQNKELKEFYDDLMNTEGLMSINTMAKELGIGEYKLFAFLRNKKVFFYDKDMVNVPYERFRKEGKFAVRETPCHDGNIRSVTYATKKGLDYVRKLLRKNGYYSITE